VNTAVALNETVGLITRRKAFKFAVHQLRLSEVKHAEQQFKLTKGIKRSLATQKSDGRNNH
jgi:hypothetical protein